MKIPKSDKSIKKIYDIYLKKNKFCYRGGITGRLRGQSELNKKKCDEYKKKYEEHRKKQLGSRIKFYQKLMGEGELRYLRKEAREARKARRSPKKIKSRKQTRRQTRRRRSRN
jgi:hypothetical protein